MAELCEREYMHTIEEGDVKTCTGKRSGEGQGRMEHTEEYRLGWGSKLLCLG